MYHYYFTVSEAKIQRTHGRQYSRQSSFVLSTRHSRKCHIMNNFSHIISNFSYYKLISQILYQYYFTVSEAKIQITHGCQYSRQSSFVLSTRHSRKCHIMNNFSHIISNFSYYKLIFTNTVSVSLYSIRSQDPTNSWSPLQPPELICFKYRTHTQASIATEKMVLCGM